MGVTPPGLPYKEQKIEYFCSNEGDIGTDREFDEWHGDNGAWIVYPNGNTAGLPMRYYDGYFNLDNFNAGWYCDSCLEFIFDSAGEEEHFGEISYSEAMAIFEPHLSVTLDEYLKDTDS